MWTDFLADPLVGRTGWTLVHFIWQGTLVALLLAGALHLIDESSSHARYAVALAAFVLLAVLPAVTWNLVPGAPAPLGVESLTFDIRGTSPAGVETLHATSLHSGRGGGISQATAPNTHWTAWLNARMAMLLPYLVLGWLGGVVVLGARLSGDFVQVQRLRRRGVYPVEGPWRARFEALARRMGMHRPVGLLRSTRAEGPLALGWWRPVVLVPGSLFTGLPPEQVEAILAHELAHLRRYDDVVNLFQSALEVLLFYHPAVWWVSGQVRREREHCCDDLAAAACRSRLAYARALTELEALRGLALAPGASDGSLADRIRRILGRPAPRRTRPRHVGVFGALTVLLLVAGGIAAAAFVPSHANTESPRAVPAGAPSEAPLLVDTTLAETSQVRIALSGDTLVFGTVLEDAAFDLDSLRDQVSTLEFSVEKGDTLVISDVHLDSLLSSFPKVTVDEQSFSFAFNTDSLEMGFPEEVFALHIADSLGGLFSVVRGHLDGPERWVDAGEVPQVFFRFRPDSIAHASPSQVFFGFWPDTMEHPAPPPPPRHALPPPPPRPDTAEHPAPPSPPRRALPPSPPRPDTVEHPSPQVFFRGEWPDTVDYEWQFPDLDGFDAQALYLWADTLQHGIEWEAFREAQEEARHARQEALREWQQHREEWQEEFQQERQERMQALEEQMHTLREQLREEQEERARTLQELTREQEEVRKEALEEARRQRREAIEEAQRERQEALQELQRERQREQREIQAEQAGALREAADALQEQAEALQQERDAVEGDSQQALEKRNLLREQIRLLEQQARRLRERAGELEDDT